MSEVRGTRTGTLEFLCCWGYKRIYGYILLGGTPNTVNYRCYQVRWYTSNSVCLNGYPIYRIPTYQDCHFGNFVPCLNALKLLTA